MRPRILAAVGFLLLAITVSAGTQTRVLAIRTGRLLDVAARQERPGAVVIVEDGRIRRIDAAVPAGAQVIDLSAYTVAPGFIDAHTHVLLQGDATAEDYDVQLLKESQPFRALRATRALAIALDHGFTTLRDIGNEGAGFADVDLKQAIERGIIRGPRLFVATKALAPTGAYGLSGYAWELEVPKGVEMCDGPDACRRAVRDQIVHGADWIKVYADRSYYRTADGSIRSLPNFTLDEMKAIVDQAHRTRRRVAAHSMTPSGHEIALTAGVDSIEHGDVLEDGQIQAMVERGVYLCPTLTVGEFVAGPRSVTNPIWSTLRDASHESFRKAYKAGVKIVVGTDAGGFDWDKINEAEEFRRYTALGMTAWDALRAGTVVAAELLDQTGTLGTIAPGARADLVAMRDNPLTDMSATERVAWVMKDGVVVRQLQVDDAAIGRR
jgi:imidazolonepropionase-like amidohydrolase